MLDQARKIFSIGGSCPTFANRLEQSLKQITEKNKFTVVSKLKCPVFLAREMSGFGFTTSNIYPAVGAVGMWESQAAFWPDFSKPLREATLFVAFRGGVISTASV